MMVQTVKFSRVEHQVDYRHYEGHNTLVVVLVVSENRVFSLESVSFCSSDSKLLDAFVSQKFRQVFDQLHNEKTTLGKVFISKPLRWHQSDLWVALE